MVTSATDASYNGMEAHGVSANVADEDTPSMVFNTDGMQVMIEGKGTQGTYTIRMVHPPSADVTITVVAPTPPSQLVGSKNVFVTPQSLTFEKNGNRWKDVKTVTVSVEDDNVKEGKEAIAIAHTVAQFNGGSEYDNLIVPMVQFSILDSEEFEFYLIEGMDGGMRVSETGLGTVGKTASYTMLMRPCVSTAVRMKLVYDSAQVQVSREAFDFTTSNGCEEVITVTAVDDEAVEGFHYTTVQHEVETANADFAAAAVPYVGIQILDNEAPGMVLLESHGSTDVIEGGLTDTYEVYLTKEPQGSVTVSPTVKKTKAIEAKFLPEREQVSVSPATLTFDSSNYYIAQTVTVTAVVDNAVDDHTVKEFGAQPSLAYQIQGSLTVSGDNNPTAIDFLPPVMLPGETDSGVFADRLDNPNLDVIESMQIDTLTVENTGGFLPTTVTLLPGRVTGMGMGTDRVREGKALLGGIQYSDLEVVVLNLGAAVDTVVVGGTHTGATYINAGKGDDTFQVYGAVGPTYVNGQEGDDTFVVGDDAGKLVQIKDLVSLSGGSGEHNTLHINNWGGNPDLGFAGFLSRTDLSGFGMVAKRGEDSKKVHAVTVRGTSGAFALSFEFDGMVYHLDAFSLGTAAKTIEDAMQHAVFGADPNRCGNELKSKCTRSFAVDSVDSLTYIVRYEGEAETAGGAITVDVSGVVNGEVEYLAGADINSRVRLAGINYGDMRTLEIDMGTTAKDAINVRGVSIPTAIRTHGGDDVIALGSDANLVTIAEAGSGSTLPGWLKYIQNTITLDAGTGCNRLMVSDSTGSGKGVDGERVILEKNLIRNLAPVPIPYVGTFTGGITVWTGQEKDKVYVRSTILAAVEGERVVTTLNTGGGDDEVEIYLGGEIPDGFFVVNGEGGNDVIDARETVIPLVIVGGLGSDTIYPGQKADIIFGDEGTVTYGGTMSIGSAHGSTGQLDGKAAPPTSAQTAESPSSACAAEAAGSKDVIVTKGCSRYIIFGGPGGDEITTEGGLDFVFGDLGSIEFDAEGRVVKMESTCPGQGSDDTINTGDSADIVFGGPGADVIDTGRSDDVVFGDHGMLGLGYFSEKGAEEDRHVTVAESRHPSDGGADVIDVGYGNNTAFGGASGDRVLGSMNRDFLFGDHGRYTSALSKPTDFTLESLFAEQGGDDTLSGQSGHDFLFGGAGEDAISGGEGRDTIFGDHGAVEVGVIADVATAKGRCAVGDAVALGARDVVYGGDDEDTVFGGAGSDELHGGDNNDVLFGDCGEFEVVGEDRKYWSVSGGAAAAAGDSDALFGEDDDDILVGGQGGDNVVGGAGDDWMFGDSGAVEVSPSKTYATAETTFLEYGGEDTLGGGEGNDLVFGGPGSDEIHGGDHKDVLFGDFGRYESISAGSRLYDASFEVVDQPLPPATGAKDTIYGGESHDIIFGGAGADVVEGGAGRDWMFGDYGKALLDGSLEYFKMESTSPGHGAGDQLSGGDEDDVIFGGRGADTIHAGKHDDVVFGDFGSVESAKPGDMAMESLFTCEDGGADLIYGEHGNDVLIGGFGSDVIEGFTGKDWIIGDHGKGTLAPSLDFRSVESILGCGANDTLVGGDEDDYIFGCEGKDTIDGNEHNDAVFGDHGKFSSAAHGEGHWESILTEAEHGDDDVITTHDGDDIVFGGQGIDKIVGGAGRDWLFGDHGLVNLGPTSFHLESTHATSGGGADDLRGGDGMDYLFGGFGQDKVYGERENDVLFGDHGAITSAVPGDIVYRSVLFELADQSADDSDVLVGDIGDDIIFGGGGVLDVITGHTGKDWIFGDFGEIEVRESEELTIMTSTSPTTGGDDEISAGDEDDVVFGGTGKDSIKGEKHNDVIFGDHGRYQIKWSAVGGWRKFESLHTGDAGEGGDDVLSGSVGDDIIIGGQGGDTVHGGDGKDFIIGDQGEIDISDDPATSDTWSLRSTASLSGGNDHLYGESETDVIIGGFGDDEVVGSSGEDILLGDHGEVYRTTHDSSNPDVGGLYVKSTFTDSDGEGGADTITGSYGRHIIMGGQGDDVITVAEGSDWIFGDHGHVRDHENGTYTLESLAPLSGGADTISAGDADDIVFGGYGNDTIDGSNGNNVVFGDHGFVQRNASDEFNMTSIFTEGGEGGSDTIDVQDGKDYVFGGQSNDVIRTRGGDDSVFGDHGSVVISKEADSLVYESTAPALADGGNDEILTGGGDDIVFGGSANDVIDGEDGVDFIFGDFGRVRKMFTQPGDLVLQTVFDGEATAGSGDDTIHGSAGDDILFGGRGADSISGNAGLDVVFGDIGIMTRTPLTGLTHLVTTGDAADGEDDHLNGDEENDILLGGGGEDTINGGDGDDFVFGDAGEVHLNPSSHWVRLRNANQVGGGSDVIDGGLGDDKILAGAGGDVVHGGAGGDVIIGDYGKYETTNPGDFTVKGSAGPATSDAGAADKIFAGEGDDVVVAGEGDDEVDGEGGNDYIFGDLGEVAWTPSAELTKLITLGSCSGGDDTITAGAGDDYVFGGAGGDVIDGNGGADVIVGDHGLYESKKDERVLHSTHTESGCGGDDKLNGDEGDDFIIGGQGADHIDASSGNDVVFGDHGDVLLSIKKDEHTLKCLEQAVSGGNDTIVAGAGDDSVFGGADRDVIDGGEGNDVVFGDCGEIKRSYTSPEDRHMRTVFKTPGSNGDADTVAGSDGDDIIFGGAGGDDIVGGAGDDKILGDHGSVDIVDGGVTMKSTEATLGGGDTISGNEGDDVVIGGAAADEVSGNSGRDFVFGDHAEYTKSKEGDVTMKTAFPGDDQAGGADTLNGDEGDDVLFGGAAADVMHGNAGDDWIFGDFAEITIPHDGNNVHAVSTDPGMGGGDELHGDDGADVLVGGAGDDELAGGVGNDVLFGDYLELRWGTAVADGSVTLESVFTEDQYGGGADEVSGGAGSDVIVGGNGGDNLKGNPGDDWMFGDHMSIETQQGNTGLVSHAEPMSQGTGGADTMFGGDDNDVMFGGKGDDVLEGEAGHDVAFGDFAVFERSTELLTFTSVSTGDDVNGGADHLKGGAGNDLLAGQQGSDTLDGEDGQDMLWGDQVVAKVNAATLKVVSAETIDPLAGASDVINGGSGDDYVFGGTGNDVLNGNAGSDVVMGDHAAFEGGGSTYLSLFTSSDVGAGDDTINGGEGDDFLMGQQGKDTINGGDGDDDITGGHNVLGGVDSDDTIFGEEGSDVVLGDNGVISRTVLTMENGAPFDHEKVWERYPGSAMFADVVRTIQRFDDVDEVSGNDSIDGGAGNDILHGQRGDDTLHGQEGDDELFGELGDDVLHGGEGRDVLIGDVGHVVRSLRSGGSPRLNERTGAWHRDVVLEEPVTVTGWLPTWESSTFTADEAATFFRNELLVSMGAFESQKVKATAPSGEWETAIAGMRLKPAGHDTLNGGDGDDYLFGQRGDDVLSGEGGNDLLYGDDVSSVYHYDSDMPLVSNVIRVLSVEDSAANSPPLEVDEFGTVMHVGIALKPESSNRAAAMQIIEGAAMATVLPTALEKLHEAVGVADVRRTDDQSHTMRGYVSMIPDAVRNQRALYGNDVLNGGDGNDIVVGDSATHHAMMNLRIGALDCIHDSAGARWIELQKRLLRASTDLRTYESDQGTYALPAEVVIGNDVVNGGNGNDLLVGDNMQSFVDVIFHDEIVEDDLEIVVKGMMHVLYDYSVLAADAAHAVFEAHHAIVEALVANSDVGVAAPAVELSVSNDVMRGNNGNDVLVGDGLVLVSKTLTKNPPAHDHHGEWQHEHTGHYRWNGWDWEWVEYRDYNHNGDHHDANQDDHNDHFDHYYPSDNHDKHTFTQLFNDLEYKFRRHVDVFSPSHALAIHELGHRSNERWNALPLTKWGSDELNGNAGDDVVIGDYGILFVNTFAGAHADPTTEHDFQHIDVVQDMYMSNIQDTIKERALNPAKKLGLLKGRDEGLHPYSNLVLYNDKGMFLLTFCVK